MFSCESSWGTCLRRRCYCIDHRSSRKDRLCGNCTVSARVWLQTYAGDLTIVDKLCAYRVASVLLWWWNAPAKPWRTRRISTARICLYAIVLIHSRPGLYYICQCYSLERVLKDRIRWVMTLWRYWFNILEHFFRPRCIATFDFNANIIYRSLLIFIIINDIYMAQVRRKEVQQMRQVNCHTLSVASVMKNVFSRLWNADSDMSNRSAAGRLFRTTGPLTAKLRSP